MNEWDASVAVSVRNVSKVYTIWNSARARLVHPLLGILKRVLYIFPEIRRIEDFITNPPYEDFYALRDVSLDIKKGESWGFIGVNGSGKSTLLKIIAGNLNPTQGEVIVDGRVGIMDYSAGMNDDYTGRENVFMQAAIKGMTRKEIEAKMGDIEAFADIGNFIDQPTKTYSSGMKARLGFALMAHIEYDILISDEALAVGDAFFVEKCMGYIRSFLADGTFIFVSHSIEGILSLCDKAVWLDHGRVMAIGDAKSVADQYIASYVTGAPGGRGPGFSSQHDDADTGASEEDAGFSDWDGDSGCSEVLIEKLIDQISSRNIRDARIDAPANSLWAGESKIVEFSPESLGNGTGGAKILDVALLDDDGNAFSHVVGGEMVTLVIRAIADKDIRDPVVGFQFKNDLGQALFGDNTLLTRRRAVLSVAAGRIFSGQFRFQFPLLKAGEYLILAAVGSCEGNSRETFHWHNDALLVQCTTSANRRELVGIPMDRIRMEVEKDNL